MTTRPPIIDRPQDEVFVPRPIPEHKSEDAELEHGWVWDDQTGQIIGYEGINPSPDEITVTFQVGALQERFTIPGGTRERLRIDLPPSRRLACRRATIADHLWQQRSGWVVPGVSSIHIERTYARPVRNSPSVASAAVTEFFSGATTTHNVPMPATVTAGDLLLVMWFHDNASLTQASGFAPLGTESATDRIYLFGRVAVGDEDGANVNFQALTASFALAHTYRITAGTWAGVLAAVTVTGANGSSATPDPPNHAPYLGSDDHLWLVFAGKISTGTVTGAPTNYTNFTSDSSNLSGSARRSTTAASENPGTFSGSGTDTWMTFTISVPSDDIDLGDIPVFVSVGNTVSGTAGVTVPLPGGIVTGDKLLLHIQGEGEDANADPANADWTVVDTQASATGGAAGDTRLTVYEVDYDSGTPPDLDIGDAGDHVIAFITAWRDPNGGTLDVHVFQGTTDATADTSLSATGVTTTADNGLIVVSVGLGDDSGVLAWVNASLAAPPITPAGSDRTTQGADGSLGVAFGGLASQGASGTTTGTLATSEEEANIVLALVPVAGGTPATVTPATVTATATVPGPTATGAALRTPATVPAVASAPQPTILAASLVAGVTVDAVATVPQPVIDVAPFANPATVPAAATVPAPSIIAGAVVEPLTVEAIAAVPQPTTTTDAFANPDPVGAVASVHSPAILAAALVTPATVPAVATVPTPVAAVPGEGAPAVVAILASVHSPTITAGAKVTPMVVAINVAVPTPSIFTGVLEIIARVLGQFQRLGSTRLHIARLGRSGRRGFRITAENWERVSDPFVFDEHEDGRASEDETMEAVSAAWATHAGSDAATLKTAIHQALDALGYRRPDGTRLV